MEFNEITSDEMLTIEFENGYAEISIGDKTNRFLCYKEDEEQLLHMIEVIANSRGLYGTDIVDFKCIIDKCSNHRFSVYPGRKLTENDSIVKIDSKAIILFIIGCNDMGLSDVNSLINEIVKENSAEAEIIFTAENSEMIAKGHYTLCVLE